MKALIPIKWEPQFSKELRVKPLKSDGAYGLVNGTTFLFVYRTSDPYCKGWKSWEKNAGECYKGGTLRYRTHWNVWLYWGATQNSHQQIRALKSMRHAKRAGRRLLTKKINAMLQ